MEMLMTFLLKVFWFLLPAGAANMAPVFAAKCFPRFNYTVDGGRTFRGKRFFGEHKTYRGFVAGILFALMVFLLQRSLYSNFPLVREWSLFPYDKVPLIFGPCMGFGALLGDLIKSFIKRQVNIQSGQSWFPFDQIDWILGTFGIGLFFVSLPGEIFLASLFLGLLLSMIARAIGYFLGLNDEIL